MESEKNPKLAEEEELLKAVDGEVADPNGLDERQLLGLGDEHEPMDQTGGGDNGGAVLPPKADEKAVLQGAKMAQLGNADRDQLLMKIQQLETDVAKAYDERDKTQGLNNKLKEENDRLIKDAKSRKHKAEEADRKRAASQAALVAAFRGDDLRSTRECRVGMDSDRDRKEIRVGHRLHPDYACKECGRRTFGALFPTEKHLMGEVAGCKFDTLRELGSLVDLKDSWKTMTPLDVMLEVKERADKKMVSSNALRKAYQRGICYHALDAVAEVSAFGVFVDGEEQSVSDAISEQLMRGGGRKTRKPCVLLFPVDSIISGLRGSWKDIEEMSYSDENDLKNKLQGMETAESFPKALWIVLKSEFSTRIFSELRAYIDEMTKRCDLTCYLSADVLPAEPKEFKSELVLTHQQWLTSWKMDETTDPNLMLITQVSGLIWKTHPFINLFVVARRESKELLEKTIRFIVDGGRMPSIPNEPVEEKKKTVEPMKRPMPSTSKPGSQASSSSKKTRRYFDKHCHICGSTEHLRAFHDKDE